MNAELMDNDSSDNDIFILKEIKPVNKSTERQIRHCSTLPTLYSKGNKKRKKSDKVRKASTDLGEIKSKKKQACFSISSSPESLSNCATDLRIKKNKSPSSAKHDLSDFGKNNNSKLGQKEPNKNGYVFTEMGNVDPETPEITSPTKYVNISDTCMNNSETIQISPGISRKRKRYLTRESRFKLDTPKKKSIQKPLIKMFNAVEEAENSKMEEFNIKIPTGVGEKDTISGDLLTFLLKKMITAEMEKQIHLVESNFRNGKMVENLLSESESAILKKFFNLTENACAVFVRMLTRKKSWHRISEINYKDISDNIKNEFEILHKENYVDINIEDENLKTQMNLLKKSEISKLCKEFNVSSKFMTSSRKEALINSLIQEVQKQKSVTEMLKKTNSTTRLDRLRAEVKKCLGMCIKLNSRTFWVFYKVLVLFSFPHYYGEEDKRFRNELFQSFNVYKNKIQFPHYEVLSTVVFETKSDLEEYINALLLQDSFEIAISNKNYEEFASTFLKAKEKFKRLIKNNEYEKRFLNMKPFLRKFSAGTVCARILTKYCKTFKKKTEKSEIKDTVKILLNQNLFLVRKKGEWYEILAKILESQKENNTAAEVIIESLKDPLINEVQKLTLQLRGQLLLKKQNCGVNQTYLRNILQDLCELSVKEPCHIEIKGKALDGNETGHKSVYIEESEHGKKYTTVEERAISHYKANGFTKGYHSEGLIIQSVYFLLFFDIIYGISSEGVFQSPYQEAPLDFHSSSFYLNRKESIDILLSDMLSWDDKEVEAKIKIAYDRHYNTTCLITWSNELTPGLFCELVKCITMPVLVQIFQRFVRNFREVRAGFPDLTLWNPITNHCKFVEVKSPSDRLSPAQRLWLDFLKNIGLDCEVCNVKNVSSRSFERVLPG